MHGRRERMPCSSITASSGKGCRAPSPGSSIQRVAELIRGEMSLLAYHLPLDRHPELGNNAVACRAFGLGDLQPFGFHDGLPTGFKGRFPEPIPAAELVARCRRIYAQEPLAFLGGPDAVSP